MGFLIKGHLAYLSSSFSSSSSFSYSYKFSRSVGVLIFYFMFVCLSVVSCSVRRQQANVTWQRPHRTLFHRCREIGSHI